MEEHENQGAPQPAMMSEEQAADLFRLERAADEPNRELEQMEQEEQQAVVAEVQSLEVRNAAALSFMVELAVPTFERFGFPTVAKVLAAPTTDHTGAPLDNGLNNGQMLAVVWAPVFAKYHIDLGNMSDKYKVEITAVMVSVPIAAALYQAVRADSVKGRAQAALAPVAPVQSAPPVTLGTAAPAVAPVSPTAPSVVGTPDKPIVAKRAKAA